MRIRTLQEAPIKKGTRVIVRADLDVPVRDGKIADPFRILESISTFKFILRRRGHLRIITKIGRPGGKFVRSLSVKPVACYLEKLLKRKVLVISDPLNDRVLEKYGRSPGILLFENIRFWPEEEKGSAKFARDLTRWGDVYINEAFAMSHRNDVSMVALAKLLPSFAGLHLEKEVSILSRLLKRPQRPFLAVIGGIKLETKLPLVKRFLREADRVFIGGGVANSVFRAKGFETGKSTVDNLHDRSILRNKKLYLPPDVVVAREVPSRYFKIAKPEGAQGNEYIVDVGPKSIELFDKLLRNVKTVVWNGPLGFTPYFSKGTKEFARKLAGSRAFRVVGGGDTIAALRKFGMSPQAFTHISTGGGAMLEFLAGKKLPGIEVLKSYKT